jgi:hypothetical protein
MRIETFSRSTSVTTVDGEKTSTNGYVRLLIDTGPSGILSVEVDAGDWSRSLANPGKLTSPANLDIRPRDHRVAG